MGKTSESVQPRNEEILPALYFDEGRQVEEEGLLCAWHRHLRAFPAYTIDRILLVRIEAQEFADVPPFLLHKLELPFDVGVDEEVDQAAINSIVVECAVGQVRAVLNAAPDQAVTPHRGRA